MVKSQWNIPGRLYGGNRTGHCLLAQHAGRMKSRLMAKKPLFLCAFDVLKTCNDQNKGKDKEEGRKILARSKRQIGFFCYSQAVQKEAERCINEHNDHCVKTVERTDIFN